jgi:hypothetical protein
MTSSLRIRVSFLCSKVAFMRFGLDCLYFSDQKKKKYFLTFKLMFINMAYKKYKLYVQNEIRGCPKQHADTNLSDDGTQNMSNYVGDICAYFIHASLQVRLV